MTNPSNDRWKKEEAFEWPPGSGNLASQCWSHRLMPSLKVLRSESEMRDGSKWIHVSMSRPDQMPEYWEIVKVKDDFIGDQESYQVFAKKKDHVNVHNYCLHLWSPLTEFSEMANLQNIVNEKAL